LASLAAGSRATAKAGSPSSAATAAENSHGLRDVSDSNCARTCDGFPMSTASWLVVLGAFLASAVEMGEALTIVLGVGIVRAWRSTLIGAGAAAAVLAVLVGVLGPALTVI